MELSISQQIYALIEEGCREKLLDFLKGNESSEILQALLTTSIANHDRKYKHEPEIVQDAAELLGSDVSSLNALQLCCFLGDEEMALDILEFIAKEAEESHTKIFVLEFLGKQWGDGNTSLHLASFLGMSELVERLLILGANANKRNERKYKAVDCADDDTTRKLFLEHLKLESSSLTSMKSDASLEEEEKEEKTPKQKPQIGPQKKVKFEISSLISCLVKENEVSELKILMKPPLSFQISNHFGATPLHWACESGSLELVKFIVDYHRNLSDGTISHGSLINGLNIDAKDCEGWTPLHSAAAEGHLEIVKYLLSIGANPNILNDEDESMVDVAEADLKSTLSTFLS